MDVRITGAGDLATLQKALRQIGDKGLGRQLSRGLSKATDALPPAIRAEAGTVMPSGYAPVLSRSLRFRRGVKAGRTTAEITYRVYGDGQKERRDVRTLNRGTLRHPVYGRSRRLKRGPKAGTIIRNPWAAQKVRSGFVDKPVDRLAPEIRRQMDAVVTDIANQIKG